jgi:hypothetical protein
LDDEGLRHQGYGTFECPRLKLVDSVFFVRCAVLLRRRRRRASGQIIHYIMNKAFSSAAGSITSAANSTSRPNGNVRSLNGYWCAAMS